MADLYEDLKRKLKVFTAVNCLQRTCTELEGIKEMHPDQVDGLQDGVSVVMLGGFTKYSELTLAQR